MLCFGAVDSSFCRPKDMKKGKYPVCGDLIFRLAVKEIPIVSLRQIGPEFPNVYSDFVVSGRRLDLFDPGDGDVVAIAFCLLFPIQLYVDGEMGCGRDREGVESDRFHSRLARERTLAICPGDCS